MSAQIRFKTVAIAVSAMVALAATLASPQAAPSGDLSRYPMILTLKFSRAQGEPEGAVLDLYARISGDACPAKLHAALKNAGARVFLHASFGGSVFNLNGTLQDGSDVSDKNVDLNSVSEVELRIQPWWPAQSIRSASHFANVMFSEPWKKLQKKEIAGGGLSAVSWAYVRAALVTANLKPIVRPEELKENDIENDWMKSDRSWLAAPPTDNSDAMKLLDQMCDFLSNGDDQKLFDTCRPSRTPTNFRDFATSHQLEASDVEATKFVSLTTANILVDEMRFENGKSVPAGVIATMQKLLDQVAAECSKTNVTEELNELRALQSSRTLNPVDLAAFQNARRSVIEKYPSKFELNVFDDIQALK